MAKKTKTLGDVTTVTTIIDYSAEMIPITNERGYVTKISLANLKAALLGDINMDAINDGVLIMYHSNINNKPFMCSPSLWIEKQNMGEIADGVLIVDGGRYLLVAPTEKRLPWSSIDISVNELTDLDYEAAINDWNGKAKTAELMRHDECNTSSYAPGFCGTYSRVNANGHGMTSGKWWLPSMAELVMIHSHFNQINYALSLISDAKILTQYFYWSSTELDESISWRLQMGSGQLDGGYKVTGNYSVRPVSTFLM